ncbi:cocaine- and amphetamine-regulated transcript protein-like [Hemiscyllium ocellatum]|uniref:cocaine- and amphetamine-regulated transcript protein-like n=1 Tax=Hemiscyllium ocellatum TaxID=170820 RepID=UPI0029664147|nr:cocaine- and amphetamine-regulated transcript protein-like [Hemiscyllium ocellatum]
MDSDRLLAAIYFSVLLSVASGSDSSDLETRALRDFYPKDPYPSSEKELLGALQEVLEKLQTKRLPAWEKKFGQVPLCDVGEQCAVRKGARIGKLCDCPRSSGCNFFLLKCL